MSIAHLALRVGDREQVYSFSEEAVVGRGAAADIAIPDPSISRRHALVRLEGKTVVLEDLGSANGTFLKGDPVRMATRAEDGDAIRIGAVELELRIDEDAPDEISDPIATPTQILAAEDG